MFAPRIPIPPPLEANLCIPFGFGFGFALGGSLGSGGTIGRTVIPGCGVAPIGAGP